jgi:hypothetical protein
MTTDSTNFDSFVPVYSAAPEKPEGLRTFTVEQLRLHATGINFREIGWMLDREIVTGKNFIPGVNSPSNQTFRTVFRKVVVFGALPNSTSTPVAHGITNDINFTLVDSWASATDPIALKEITFGYQPECSVSLQTVGANVIITTTANYSNYTRCYVVLEYLLEV